MRAGFVAALLGTLAGTLLLTACAEDIFAPSPDARYAALAAGGAHTCALDMDGRAWCWGSNSHGQLGVAKNHRGSASPIAVNGEIRYRAITAGDRHTCAIDLGGRAWCWGDNGNGQLGDGTFKDRAAPRLAFVGTGVSQISAGASQSCATDRAGALWCWGGNQQGQLGPEAGSAANVPTRMEHVPMVSGVAIGGGHICAAGPGGTFCWGANKALQLGGATVTSSSLPVRVSSQAVLHRVVAGRLHSCALTDRQDPVCWGDNSGGQLGVPGLTGAGTPIAPRLAGAIALLAASASGRLTCAASPVEVSCWGMQTDPRLGDVRTLPAPVAGLRTGLVGALAVGGGHACVIQDGRVLCWGEGESGQLGDGSAASSATPVGPG